MLTLVKTISTRIDSTKRRLQKFLGLGLKDVKENFLISPFGVDSHAVKDMIAVYSATTELGKGVVIGYINKNALAEVGGTRLYSTNAQGDEQFYVYLRANGKIEIGGDTNHLTRFEALETAVAAHEIALNTHTHLGNLGYPTGPPTVAFVFDISAAKTDNINIA
jgi:hypothetical protein